MTASFTRRPLAAAVSALAIGTIGLLGVFAVPAAHAFTPAQGVKCPNGSEARYSNGDRRMQCRVEVRDVRESVCSPVVFRGNGDINLNQRIEMVQSGSDTCRSLTTGASQPSQALLLPGDVASQFRREVNANGKDVFVRVSTGYRFPEGGPIYLGDPARGVTCPAGFDGDKVFADSGLRCDRKDLRRASCDIGWSIRRLNGTDKCQIVKEVFGNRITVDGDFTIPEGTTGLTGNPANNGWTLRRDHSGNTDYWAKNSTDFRFPATP